MTLSKLLAMCGLLWLLLLAAGLHVGVTHIEVWPTLLGIGADAAHAELHRQVMFEIRLPRLLIASAVGGSLAMAGAAMQGLLRNPLAEPGIVGVSAGAALFAVLVLYFGWVSWHSALLPLSAVLGSCAALALVLLLSGREASVTRLILAGVAVSSAVGGGIALALSLAPNPFAMQEISFWLMGSVAHRDLTQLALMLPFMVAGVLLLWRGSRFLQVLTLGENTATTLGFSVSLWRALVLLGVALLTGAAVAIAGIVGFVGLMVPHMVRAILGEDPRRVLWGAAAMGACFVLLIDLIIQLLPTPNELKLGIVTSLIGAPFFIFLLYRRTV